MMETEMIHRVKQYINRANRFNSGLIASHLDWGKERQMFSICSEFGHIQIHSGSKRKENTHTGL